uniref:Phosphatidylinositol-specific phospholipase C X domain-containing protein n=1 Tax=Bionectria ochroleuca TaxID=29856 RepID=A0A8H7KEK3_BIOOC
MPKLVDSLPKPPWRQGPFRFRRMPILLAMSSIFAMVLFYVLISMSPCMVGSQRCYKGYTSAYSFDAYHAHHPRWMTAIPDDVNLTSLSIPGTHDTMTYGMPENEHLQCQIWNLTTQLNAGLRYFDIRARLQDDELKIYHSSGFTGFSYTDVLVAMFDFLDRNPGETIIMRFKEEGVPIGDHNTISFEDALIKHHESSPSPRPGRPSTCTTTIRPNPSRISAPSARASSSCRTLSPKTSRTAPTASYGRAPRWPWKIYGSSPTYITSWTSGTPSATPSRPPPGHRSTTPSCTWRTSRPR